MVQSMELQFVLLCCVVLCYVVLCCVMLCACSFVALPCLLFNGTIAQYVLGDQELMSGLLPFTDATSNAQFGVHDTANTGQ